MAVTLCCILSATLAGCAWQHNRPAWPAPLATNTPPTLIVPHTADLTFGDRSWQLLGQFESNPQRGSVLALLSPQGLPLLTVHLDQAGHLEVQSNIDLPARIEPSALLATAQTVFWPEHHTRSALPEHWSLQRTADARTLFFRKHEVLHLAPGSKPGSTQVTFPRLPLELQLVPLQQAAGAANEQDMI